MDRWFSSTFAALATPSFRVLWFGTIGSFIAFFMAMIVQSVVAFELTGTNTAVGLVVAAQGAGMGGFGPIGGAYADRWPKRRVVVICQLMTAAMLCGVAALLHLERLTIEMLCAAAFVMGTSFAFMGPARQSLAVELVPDEHRGNAMAVSQIANTASRVLGPVVAGFLLAWPASGATGAYLCMAFLYMSSALSMAWIPKSVVRAEASDVSVWSSVFEGFGYVWREPRLRLLVGFFISVILIGFPHVSLLPGLVENEFGIDSQAVSTLFVASAVGALLASVSVARFADAPRALSIYTGMALLFALGLGGLALSPSLLAASLFMVLVGAGNGGFQSLNSAVIARGTAPEYMGRVMSLTLIAFAGFGLMALPFGMLADRIGEPMTLGSMAGCVLVISLVLGRALVRETARRVGVP